MTGEFLLYNIHCMNIFKKILFFVCVTAVVACSSEDPANRIDFHLSVGLYTTDESNTYAYVGVFEDEALKTSTSLTNDEGFMIKSNDNIYPLKADIYHSWLPQFNQEFHGSFAGSNSMMTLLYLAMNGRQYEIVDMAFPEKADIRIVDKLTTYSLDDELTLVVENIADSDFIEYFYFFDCEGLQSIEIPLEYDLTEN